MVAPLGAWRGLGRRRELRSRATMEIPVLLCGGRRPEQDNIMFAIVALRGDRVPARSGLFTKTAPLFPPITAALESRTLRRDARGRKHTRRAGAARRPARGGRARRPAGPARAPPPGARPRTVLLPFGVIRRALLLRVIIRTHDTTNVSTQKHYDVIRPPATGFIDSPLRPTHSMSPPWHTSLIV